MLLLVFLGSVFSALLNALAAIIQRLVAGRPKRQDLFSKDFIKYMTLNKWWLLGLTLQVGAFISQAAALKYGSLVTVEPVLTVDLIFMALILRVHFKVPLGRQEWLGVAAICLGLGGFFISAQPRSGQRSFQLNAWLLAVIAILVIVALAVVLVKRTKSSYRRAAISGAGGGAAFALVAMFTKLTTMQLSHGPVYVMMHWPVYALLLSGILGVIMAQNVYGAGPVAVSQPAFEIVEPMVSILMGIILFGDLIKYGPRAILLETTAGLIAVFGIGLLAHSNRLYIKSPPKSKILSN